MHPISSFLSFYFAIWQKKGRIELVQMKNNAISSLLDTRGSPYLGRIMQSGEWRAIYFEMKSSLVTRSHRNMNTILLGRRKNSQLLLMNKTTFIAGEKFLPQYKICPLHYFIANWRIYTVSKNKNVSQSPSHPLSVLMSVQAALLCAAWSLFVLLPLVMPVFGPQLPRVLVSPFHIINTDVSQYFFQVQLEEKYRQQTG